MAKHYIEVPLTASVAPQESDAKAKLGNEQVMADAVAPVPMARPVEMPPPASLRAQSPAPMAFGRVAGKDEEVRLDSFSVAGGAQAAQTLSVKQSAYVQAKVRQAERAAAVAVAKKTEASQNFTFAADAPRTEAYAFRQDNAFLSVAQNPLSTFSADVDTASYTNVRRYLRSGHRPPPDAVRIEELVNYFPYAYAGPIPQPAQGQAGPAPFAAHLEVASAPWAPAHRLVRVGLKAREFSDAARPPANLVFLLDVSGSMNEPNKLPLVKQSLRLLVEKLRPQDRVAIAVYAGSSGLALPSTSAAKKADILEAIDHLEANGSTNGAMGIQLAYDIAKANFIPGGANRVILATDGDFNVGVTSPSDLVRLVGEKAKSGVFLTVLGFGMGNLKDSTLEDLADKGNGNYAYIDSLAEAKKTLVEQAGGTLVTVAKDVKLQVEFNPLEVQAYRLIGYENRLLAKEDFNNDQVDAGEVGSGHTITALYEIVPTGAAMPATGSVDALKYQRPAGPVLLNHGELLTLKIRYKEPAGEVSSKVEFTLADTGAAFARATPDFKFAAAVAAFGMVLRDSPYKGTATLSDVEAWAKDGTGNDTGGYRQEFVELVELAQAAQ
jgi:Ca-activated chloride channel family protein